MSTTVTYRFLEGDVINPADIERLIELTRNGALSWHYSDGRPAIYAIPADLVAKDVAAISDQLIGQNLRDIRIGTSAETEDPAQYSRFRYLRLRDGDLVSRYLEGELPVELQALTRELFDLARKALRLGGRLTRDEAGTKRFCRHCGEETEQNAIQNLAHGIPGAVMAGSQRWICMSCEHTEPYTEVS